MHMLCRGWKQATWLAHDLTKDIHDRETEFFTLLTCPDSELNAAKQAYGTELAAAKESETLRPMYKDCVTRCYQLSYWIQAHAQWSEITAAGALDVFNKARQTLESDEYKLHWVPKLINTGSAIGAIPISERIALLADKLHMLQKLCGTVDVAAIQAIVDGLLQAASISGIARQSLIGTPDKVSVN